MNWNRRSTKAISHFKLNVTWFLFLSMRRRRQWMRYKKLSLWIYFVIFMILLAVWYLHIEDFDAQVSVQAEYALLNYLRSREFFVFIRSVDFVAVVDDARVTVLMWPMQTVDSWLVSHLIENHWRWFSSRWAILMRCSEPPSVIVVSLSLSRSYSPRVRICAGWRTNGSNASKVKWNARSERKN